MRNFARNTICLLLLGIVANLALAGTEYRCWVYLREPQISPDQLQTALSQIQSTMNPRCLARRAKVRAANALTDEFDLPLNQSVLDSITARGFEIKIQSKFLRAVSVVGSYDQVKVLEGLSFVKRVEPLPVEDKETFIENPTTNPLPSRTVHPHSNKPSAPTIQWDSADYGQAYSQWNLLNIIVAHNRGYTGQGVLLGMLDEAYNRLSRNYTPQVANSYHVMFDSLQIVATRDILHGDSFVTDQNNGRHGSLTLSCIAGLEPGQYIGSAPRVSVLLAETEDDVNEYSGEEDNWVAGLEWEESYGVDVVSSSVSWWAWLPDSIRNGHTAASSIAAGHAASLGVVVVNSAANHGTDAPGSPAGPHMSCPSDADSIICAGSCGPTGNLSSWSSHGPTRDGRIKPDLLAMGESCATINPGDTDGYTYYSGTSFSAPTLAGACALVLSANHQLTPMEVIHVLKRSATHWSDPDTMHGWGIPNVDVAIDSALLIESVNAPGDESAYIPEQWVIRAFPNPFNPSVILNFAPVNRAREIEVYDLLGRLVDKIVVGAGVSRANFVAKQLPSGNYFLKFPNGNATRVSLLR